MQQKKLVGIQEPLETPYGFGSMSARNLLEPPLEPIFQIDPLWVDLEAWIVDVSTFQYSIKDENLGKDSNSDSTTSCLCVSISRFY